MYAGTFRTRAAGAAGACRTRGGMAEEEWVGRIMATQQTSKEPHLSWNVKVGVKKKNPVTRVSAAARQVRVPGLQRVYIRDPRRANQKCINVSIVNVIQVNV